MDRKHQEHWQSIGGRRQPKGFHKKLSAQKSWGIAQTEQKPAKNIERAVNRTLLCGRTSIGTGLVNSPSVTDASRHVTRPYMFLVIMQHWRYWCLGIPAIILWNQMTLQTSPSAKYCTSFKIWSTEYLSKRLCKLSHMVEVKGQFIAYCKVLFSLLLVGVCLSMLSQKNSGCQEMQLAFKTTF
jgi:hypothetical protein